MTGKQKGKLAMINAVEREARNHGKRVSREYRVVTSRLEAVIDLLVSDGAHRTAYQAEETVDLVRWNMLVAQTAKVDELQILFSSEGLARSAQKRADDVKASGRATKLSVLCLTVNAAVQRLKDANDVGIQLNPPIPSATESLARQRHNNLVVLNVRRKHPCKFATLSR